MTRSPELEDLRGLLADRVGLLFDDSRPDHLESALMVRARALGCTPRTYVDSVVSRSNELGQLMSILAVSETYFFRNAAHFRVLEDLMRRRGSQPLRVLSAGCSSGEEPYSVAMVAREALEDRTIGRISISGVDLNPDAIAKARSGRYSSWSLRETPPVFAQKYFRSASGEHALVDDVRRMVRFEEQNLLHPATCTFAPQSFDAVFCRNVLMYLNQPSAAAIVASIARALVPGGLLFLGHAENLRGLSSAFHLRHTHEAFFYERKDGPTSTPTSFDTSPTLTAATDGSWYEAIVRSAGRVEALTGERRRSRASSPAALGPALALMEAERFQEALALLPPASREDPDLMLMRAALLLVSGDVISAESTARDLLEVDELNACAHYIVALCREHSGELYEAIDRDLTALYLDPTFAMPRFHRGLLARRAGDLAAARRELEQALVLLGREDAFRILLFGGGFGREGLMQLCRIELEACRGAR